MTIDPAGRTVSSFAPPPAYGNPAIGDIFFYASPGEKITVTANHGANSYFDGWQIHNGGRCDPPEGTPSGQIGGGSPGACAITVVDPYGTGKFYDDAHAFFLACPPPGTFSARLGAQRDCPGVKTGTAVPGRRGPVDPASQGGSVAPAVNLRDVERRVQRERQRRRSSARARVLAGGALVAVAAVVVAIILTTTGGGKSSSSKQAASKQKPTTHAGRDEAGDGCDPDPHLPRHQQRAGRQRRVT